jgi:nitrous oxidase accessory protein NosD
MPVSYDGGVTTLQAAAVATADGVALDVKGAERLTVQVSGTFSGTVAFEGTLDDTTWFAVGLKTAADGAAVTTVTAAGVWKRTPDLALSLFRARVSVYASGDITVVAMKE